ncbi:hypothetical protein NDU88_007051 [Pleurodeles waltl]|uniref:Uncharacterized protein n=1 Tax=Pleurodeles waltl TaxID=8319 RepID=A0AAV7MP38_PLEWA|nr:hypothetical protein NDU88_007051 [Pleurodeles waltl]
MAVSKIRSSGAQVITGADWFYCERRDFPSSSYLRRLLYSSDYGLVKSHAALPTVPGSGFSGTETSALTHQNRRDVAPSERAPGRAQAVLWCEGKSPERLVRCESAPWRYIVTWGKSLVYETLKLRCYRRTGG